MSDSVFGSTVMILLMTTFLLLMRFLVSDILIRLGPQCITNRQLTQDIIFGAIKKVIDTYTQRGHILLEIDLIKLIRTSLTQLAA